MQKYQAKLPLYAVILTLITLVIGGILSVCVVYHSSKTLLLFLFLLLFFAVSSLISVLVMLILPRLEKFWAKKRQQKKHLK